jgi:hypothetical protein
LILVQKSPGSSPGRTTEPLIITDRGFLFSYSVRFTKTSKGSPSSTFPLLTSIVLLFNYAHSLVNRLSFETIVASFETIATSFESDRGPFESDRASFESDRVPFESDRASFESDRVSFESDRGPFESDRASFESDRGPFESDRGPFESDRGPFEHAPYKEMPEIIESL